MATAVAKMGRLPQTPSKQKRQLPVSFVLVFLVPRKSSAGNFIESISCGGSAVPFGKNKHNTLKIYLFAIVYNF
ncbi:hypothetical protein [Lactococcus cremoris]|uniref:hypothetical protein n=1 Tax=Lactococcus lactis subsp. cremoris TaxID=1359 RepID=UPI00142F8F2E|nr:hypothetical protein [Lactococcus cremoris]